MRHLICLAFAAGLTGCPESSPSTTPPVQVDADTSVQQDASSTPDGATPDADDSGTQDAATDTGVADGTATPDGTTADATPDGGLPDVPMPPTGAGLPIGIPTPSFGYDYPTADADPTIYVDNTNPACDNAGAGTAATPLCDLFRGGTSVTYEAGDVVHILGGPYSIAGDYSLTFNGTSDDPVLVLGQGAERILHDGNGERVDFDWNGSYAVIQNLAFFHKTRHRVLGDHLAFDDVSVTNPPDAFIAFNPVVGLSGHDLLLRNCEIGNNRRDNDTDSHGINANAGSYNLWILDSHLYNNNGDSFQGCHQCFEAPPHHVYIGRNLMHDDRENAVDLKTIADVVISENTMFNYGNSATSGGDAMVIGSNGFDDATNQGPRRTWVVANRIYDSANGIRIEGSEDVWVIGNHISNVTRGLQIDQKTHRDIVAASNTIVGVEDGINAWGCNPTSLWVANNLILDASDRQVDLSDCGGDVLTLANNLFWDADGSMAVRTGDGNHTDVAALDARPYSSGSLSADPMLDADGVPQSGSPAIDAGTALDTLYAAFNTAFGAAIAFDRLATPRPSGTAEDIGAYEAP